MSKLFILLAVSLICVSAIFNPLEARRHHSNVSIGINIGYAEPVYVARPYPPPYYGCAARPYPAPYYGGCGRYVGRVPPVYAYPHTVYYGPPGIVYEEIYPYPPCYR